MRCAVLLQLQSRSPLHPKRLSGHGGRLPRRFNAERIPRSRAFLNVGSLFPICSAAAAAFCPWRHSLISKAVLLGEHEMFCSAEHLGGRLPWRGRGEASSRGIAEDATKLLDELQQRPKRSPAESSVSAQTPRPHYTLDTPQRAARALDLRSACDRQYSAP